MALTPEQLAERRLGITATDVAAIVGLHPYRSVIDVRDEKRGLKPPEDLGPRVKWGNLLEPVIRADYAERHGVTVTVPGVLTHPKIAHHKATPDGLVWYRGAPEADRGLEIKTHTIWLRGGYGQAGTDEVPLHEIVQCAWNMRVTRLRRWDLSAFIDGLPVDYQVDADAEFEEGLVEAADRFWTDVIVGGAEPDPDGSEQYEEYLRGRFKSEVDGKGFAIADPGMLCNIELLKALRGELAKLELDRDRVAQVIKAFIADHEGVEFPALAGRGKTERITYRKSKDSTSTAWGLVVSDVAASLALLKSTPTLERFAKIVESWGDAFTIEGGGSSVRASDLRDLVAALRAIDLEAITKARTTPTVGPRVFNCPRTWKGETA